MFSLSLKDANEKEMMNLDEIYMKMAIELAHLGEGYVNPNPLVGAVIVKGRKGNRRRIP